MCPLLAGSGPVLGYVQDVRYVEYVAMRKVCAVRTAYVPYVQYGGGSLSVDFRRVSGHIFWIGLLIMAIKWPSMAINGHQWPFMAINGH